MWPAVWLTLLAISWHSGVLAQNNVDTGAMEALSSCVTQCSNQTLSRYDCTPEQSCFCDNPQLQTDLKTCLTSSGCSFADQLAAKKFQASTCNIPVRDRGQLLAIVAYALFGVAAVFTILRGLSRWSRLNGPGYRWDDLVAIMCLVPLTVLIVGEHYAIHYGMGKDIWGLTPDDVKEFTLWFYICTNMYTFVIFGTKISLVLLYLRVWHARDSFRNLCRLTLSLLVSALVAFQIIAIVQCLPIPYQWQRYVDPSAHGSFINRQVWVWALAGAGLGFDVVVILLPIPKLLALKEVPGTKKLGICSVFLVGCAVTAMSIVRMFYIHGITTNPNFTYYLSYIGLYSSIEAYLSQICCCMPPLAGLVQISWQKTTSKMPTTGSKRSSRQLGIGTPFRSASQEPTIDTTAIFDGVEVQDMEKGITENEHFDQVKGSGEYSSTNESADSPVVQRTSHTSNSAQLRQQRSFEASWRQRPSIRNTNNTNTTNTTSTSWRTPDILYHDRQNQVRLEIHDPPREPVKATLTYLDRFDGKHDVELQGRPQTSHEKSRSPSDSSSRPSTSPDSRYSADEIPFVGRNNLNATIKPQASAARIDQLLKAHKALTEGTKVEDVRASLGLGSKTSRLSTQSEMM